MAQKYEMTETFLRTLTLAELTVLATITVHTSAQLTPNLYELRKVLTNGKPTYAESRLIQTITNEKRFKVTSPVSGIQEKSMNDGIDVTYTAEKMIVPLIEAPVEVPVSRITIDPKYHGEGRTGVRVGSDLLSGFLSSLTKWEGEIVPSMTIENFAKRGYLSMKHPDGLPSLIPLMTEAKITEGRLPTVGCRGREWAFHIMQALQKATPEAYAALHTHFCLYVCGIPQLNHAGDVIIPPDAKDSFKVTALGTKVHRLSIFWIKDIPKTCRSCFNATSPDVSMTYQAASEGMAFRGGPGSAIGSLLLSTDSWGFPSQSRAELEIDLAVILGIKNAVTIVGCNENRANYIVAAAQHYKFGHELFFHVDRTKLQPKPIEGIKYVTDIDNKTTVYYRLASPLSTTVAKKKNSAIELYDAKSVEMVANTVYDKMISELTRGKYVVLCPYILADNCVHHLATIRQPYDCLQILTNDKTSRMAYSEDAKKLSLKEYEWLDPAAMRKRIVLCINASLGIMFGAKNFANYGRANLVRPLTGKLKRIMTFESYDEDGNSIVNYWDSEGDVPASHHEEGQPNAPSAANGILGIAPEVPEIADM